MPFHWESLHVNDVLIGQGFEDVFFLVGDWDFENDAFE
jgi:hypothetical protein